MTCHFKALAVVALLAMGCKQPQSGNMVCTFWFPDGSTTVFEEVKHVQTNWFGPKRADLFRISLDDPTIVGFERFVCQ